MGKTAPARTRFSRALGAAFSLFLSAHASAGGKAVVSAAAKGDAEKPEPFDKILASAKANAEASAAKVGTQSDSLKQALTADRCKMLQEFDFHTHAGKIADMASKQPKLPPNIKQDLEKQAKEHFLKARKMVPQFQTHVLSLEKGVQAASAEAYNGIRQGYDTPDSKLNSQQLARLAKIKAEWASRGYSGVENDAKPAQDDAVSAQNYFKTCAPAIQKLKDKLQRVGQAAAASCPTAFKENETQTIDESYKEIADYAKMRTEYLGNFKKSVCDRAFQDAASSERSFKSVRAANDKRENGGSAAPPPNDLFQTAQTTLQQAQQLGQNLADFATEKTLQFGESVYDQTRDNFGKPMLGALEDAAAQMEAKNPGAKRGLAESVASIENAPGSATPDAPQVKTEASGSRAQAARNDVDALLGARPKSR